MERVIPPTDSRLRPDIRAMENGDMGMYYDLDLSPCCDTLVKTPYVLVAVFFTSMSFVIDLASADKKRLEEKQRMARKTHTKSTEEWKTRSVCH